jgi:DNA polymerase-1
LDVELKKTGQEKLLYELEVPLVNVLSDMELEGVKLDVGALKELSRTLQDDILRGGATKKLIKAVITGEI